MDSKDELVKQHAKVAEDAYSGWEKAENEVVKLKQKLSEAANKNIVLEDRVSHLDGALKECVRQLRQSRDNDQDKKIQEAATERRTKELKSGKAGLERRVLELQKQAEAAKAENLMLREEFEIVMIERDLSTQTAENASKQHLDSIKKVAKLEAECRKLRILVKSSSSSVSSNRSSDSHSDGGRERIEGIWSDSSALVSGLDQFKIKKGDDRSLTSSIEVDLMDDFLEMERLVTLPKKSKTEYELSLMEKLEKLQAEKDELENDCREAERRLSLELEAVVGEKMELEDKLKKMEAEKAEVKICFDVMKDQYQESRVCSQEVEMKLEKLQAEKNELDSEVKRFGEVEKRLSLELEAVVGDKMELKDKLEKMEAEKAELKMSNNSMKDQYQESRVCFQEVEMKLEEIKRELKLANEYKTESESRFMRMEAEVRKEKSVSDELREKCEALEEELKREREEKTIIKRENVEPKINQEDIATAAGKFLDCQKTIASLGKQLQSLATLDDFLIDTSNILDSVRSVHKKEMILGKDPPECIKTVNGIKNSNTITSPSSCLSSSDSTTVSLVMSSNRGSSEKNRNGFATVFTRSRNGIHLGI